MQIYTKKLKENKYPKNPTSQTRPTSPTSPTSHNREVGFQPTAMKKRGLLSSSTDINLTFY